MLTRWDPWKEFDDIFKEADRLFDACIERWAPDPPVSFIPPAEVGEGPDGLVVRIALPGVLEEDIDITLGPGRLVVRGERQAPAGHARVRWSTAEMRYGQFVREIALPGEPRADRMRAVFSEGLLTIRIPTAGR